MPYYEVIYETGAHSVLNSESDEQVMEGLNNHHERALNGMRGQLESSSSRHPSHDAMHGPGAPVPVATHQAERVKRVLRYDTHPGDSTDFDTSPRVDPASKHPHESNYGMAQTGELDLTQWGIN